MDANLGITDGTYANVTLGAPGPLAGSSETAASFNGTSSSVSLPASLIADQNYVSAGLWFKAANPTASGVLFSYQADALSNPAGNSVPHVPALYVGGNGKLYGGLWNGSVDPMSSSVNVDDGNWHYAVITGSGTSQALWLDGTQVATLAGQISARTLTNDTVGAGFWGGSWPEAYATEGPSLLDTAGRLLRRVDRPGRGLPAPARPARHRWPVRARRGPLSGADPGDAAVRAHLPAGRLRHQPGPHRQLHRPARRAVADPHRRWPPGTSPPRTAWARSPGPSTVTDPAGHERGVRIRRPQRRAAGHATRRATGRRRPGRSATTRRASSATVTDSDGNLVCLTNDIHGNVLSVPGTRSVSLPARSTGAAGAAAARQGRRRQPRPAPRRGAPCTTYYSYYYNSGQPAGPAQQRA